MALQIRERNGSVSFAVRVQPRAKADAVGGVRAGALVVRLQAPPVEGAANEALRRVLARALAVPASAVEIARGHAGRDKLVRARGVAAAEVEALARG